MGGKVQRRDEGRRGARGERRAMEMSEGAREARQRRRDGLLKDSRGCLSPSRNASQS